MARASTAAGDKGVSVGPVTYHITRNAALVIMAEKHPGQETQLTPDQFRMYVDAVVIAHLVKVEEEAGEAAARAREKELEGMIEDHNDEISDAQEELDELREARRSPNMQDLVDNEAELPGNRDDVGQTADGADDPRA